MSYFPEDIPFMSKEELRENGIRIPKDVPDTNAGDNSEIPNSSDTISRQAALDAINRCRDDYDLARQEQIDDCENAVRELSTVTERTGHWIWDAGDLVCSECGTRYSDLYPDYDDSVACPHCGAHMKGGETE